jgi:hypothetical protein
LKIINTLTFLLPLSSQVDDDDDDDDNDDGDHDHDHAEHAVPYKQKNFPYWTGSLCG